MESDLLTVGELSVLLKMSRPWIYKQVEAGSLPFLRLGQAIRFDQEEIKKYIESRRNLKGGKDEN